MSYSEELYGNWMYDRLHTHPNETLAEANAVYNMEQEAEAVVQEAADAPHKVRYEAALANAPVINDYDKPLIYSPDGAGTRVYTEASFCPNGEMMRSMPTKPTEGAVVMNWDTDLPDHIVGTVKENA